MNRLKLLSVGENKLAKEGGLTLEGLEKLQKNEEDLS